MATFLLDNDLSFRIARALDALDDDHQVRALRDEFEESAKDVEWLSKAGELGWIVVSRDYAQRRRDAERAVIRKSGVKVIYIRCGSRADTLFADAARVIKNWPKIRHWATTSQTGSIARLNTKDQIEQL